MKLRTRILAGYTTVSLLILGLGAAILFTINTVSPVVDELDREVTALGRGVSLSGLSGRIVSLRTELSRTAYQFVLTQDLGYERRYERTSRELSEVFEQAIKKSDSEDDATIFRNLRETSLKLGISERGMINLARAKKIEQAKALAQSEDYVELNVAISDFVATLASRKQAHSSDVFSRLIDVSRATQINREKLDTLARVTTVSVVLILIASIVVGAFIARSISRPLTLLKEGAVAIGKGDLTQRIGMSRTDEIGEVAKSFDEMTEKLETIAVELVEEIEERKRAEEALREANAELEAFTYSVSHDLRAPLRAMDGFSKVLLEDYADKLDAEGRDHLGRVRGASQSMAQLIDDLLKLSGLARAELRCRRVDLSQLAETISAEFRKAEPDRQVTFDIAADVVAAGDEHLLRIVLENLLDNAWKFTSKQPKARIEFGVTENEGQPAYFVRDGGVGFDIRYADKLFQPFQRLHKSDEFPGSGIGLATVARIVRRHGGRVWAESDVGQGTTLYFSLGTEGERA